VVKSRAKNEPSDALPLATDSALSFEARITALGQIVEQLERGDLPLEESLNLFEQGIRLSKDAQAKLDEAEQRIETLLGFDDQDAPITREPEPGTPR
jgi:exodeoxyribonuclease VII small subunit